MSFESSTAFIIENDSETIVSSLINDDNMTSNGSLSVKRDEKLVILEIGILSVIFILIVFGNLCVLIALQVRKLKMNRMYYFLLHLCIADLIAAFFNVIPQLAWEITHRFYGGNLLCKTIKYLQILGPYLSSYVLVMTAVDRYQAICYPLSNCAWTPSRSKLMISCAWIVSLLCCVPQTIIFSYREIPGTDGIHDCWGTFHKPWGERIYVTWYALSVFIIPFIILTFTHVHISREIWLNLHKKRKSFKVNRNKESISSNKRNDRLDCDSLNLSETSEQISGTRLLVTVGKSYRFKGKGQVEVSVEKDCGKEDYSPRTHSIHGLTRAKIKTVKITIVIIMCYIFCSSPFICVQLWANWWPNAQQSPIWNGPIIAVLMLLPSLNSCVNPWIYLYFNQNLVSALREFCCRKSISIDETNGNNETKRYKSRFSQKENDSQSSIQLSQLNDTPNSSRKSRLKMNKILVIRKCHKNSSNKPMEPEII